uniref:Uncharacterized protein n=1 Tax=Romanomermis culicivorax TaxID=13658 RepID=A0A915J0K5_ROMCU
MGNKSLTGRNIETDGHRRPFAAYARHFRFSFLQFDYGILGVETGILSQNFRYDQNGVGERLNAQTLAAFRFVFQLPFLQ